MLNNWIEEAEKIIGYTFKNKSLLIRAFTHSSYSNEHKNFPDYERLEFLGDSALNFIMSVYLYNYFPNMTEGQLTKKRAGIVGEEALSQVMEDMNLARFLMVGAGDVNDKSRNSSAVKCDLFESITGAILLDNDMDIACAKKFILDKLSHLVNVDIIDYKSKLLEELARKNLKHSFEVVPAENGFAATLYIEGKSVSQGSGSTKKAAEKQASKRYFKS